MSQPTKPEILRRSSAEKPVGNNQEIKKSILSDVDKMRVDQGKKGGGV